MRLSEEDEFRHSLLDSRKSERQVLKFWESSVIMEVKRDQARAYFRQKVKVHRTKEMTQHQVSLESPSSGVRTGSG